MGLQFGSLFDDLPTPGGEEQLQRLLVRPGLRIERIVSHGQTSPPGFWYDQLWDEWVLVASGAAVIEYGDGRPADSLAPGSWTHIPARQRHRVAWTHPGEATIWLAVHFGDGADSMG